MRRNNKHIAFRVVETPAPTARRQREHQIRWWCLGQQIYNGGSMEAHPGIDETTDTSRCQVLASALWELDFRLKSGK